jgi:hypothetical protein
MEIISRDIFVNKEYIVEYESKRYKIYIDNTSDQFLPGHHGNYITELEFDAEDDMWVDAREIDEVDNEEEFDIIWKCFIETVDIDQMVVSDTVEGFIDFVSNSISLAATKQKQVDDEMREKGYALPDESVPLAMLNIVKTYIDDLYKEFCKAPKK